MRRLKVWDLPTRLFHWSLALAVLGLIVSGNIGGPWMAWHLRLGYLVLALLLFRLGWGVVGVHWARFSHFVYSPAATWAYLKGQRQPADDIGHNPLGALSVFVMLAVLGLQVGSGLFSDDEIAFFGPLSPLVNRDTAALATHYHTAIGKLLLIALLVLHLGAVLYHQLLKGEALVNAMWHGHKPVNDPSGLLPASLDRWPQRLLALAVATGSGVVSWWIVSLGPA